MGQCVWQSEDDDSIIGSLNTVVILLKQVTIVTAINTALQKTERTILQIRPYKFMLN